MSNRKKVRLGDLAAAGRSVISGPFGSNIGKQYFRNEGIPVIRGNNLTIDYRKFIDDGFVFLTEEKADELNAYAIEGDLIFTAAGTIGQVGMIPKGGAYKRYVISNKQLRFRADTEKADPNFLYAWLASPWIFNAITNRNTGSTVPLINLGIIRSLPVVLPVDISEQKKIAAVLSALDAKIDCNNRINAELEAMAKTLYDYWFVQLDFPDANGKPYKSSGGKMVYNPTLKREIPAGWEDSLIGDVLGKVPTTTKILNKNILETGLIPVIDQGQSYICGFTNEQSSLIVPKQPHVVFGDHTRAVKLVNFNYARGADGTQILLSESQRMPGYLMYQVVSDIDLSSYGYARHFKFLKESRIVLPERSVAQRYQDVVTPWFKKIKQSIFENQELSRLRDWLLPLLMNGQVTVA
ncbi:MAG: type I restriction enzyme, S subunit [Candidatus Nitrotoga sp. CP45]|nr:MAG: type I restriction enzyme, S subunit [Candidatus Nitrotoga sp. CP45]